MRRIITPERMRAVEQAFMGKTATLGIVLMERAARAVADVALQMTVRGALVLCGPGNNGGDGYGVARLLHEAGRQVWIWTLSNPEMLRGDALANMRRCQEMKLPIRRLFTMPEDPPEGCGVVVDALFGTGLQRPLTELYGEAVAWINASRLKVLAVDMPSGMGEAMVRADRTVTFHQRKPCHLLSPGRECAGVVTVADIGILQDESSEDYLCLEAADIPGMLPPRPPDAHKGTCGHALVVAGSLGMAGAAALCAGGALRGGAGLVTVCCPEEILGTVQGLVPCAMCVSQMEMSQALPGKRSVAVGPGLGRNEVADALLPVLLEAEAPQVWDADALNWLAEQDVGLDSRFIITPHPGEAARLLHVSVTEVVRDPLEAARLLHEKYGAVTVLKGATTVIVDQDRRALSPFGTPGMATGGSGDVLTGVIAALLAQGIAPFEAAWLGAYLHGCAGEAAAARHGIRSMTAQDLLASLRID